MVSHQAHGKGINLGEVEVNDHYYQKEVNVYNVMYC